MDRQQWPTRLTVGDRVRFERGTHTITELRGRQLTLTDPAGEARLADVLTVLFDRDFALLDHAATRNCAGDPSAVEGDAMAVAHWWEPHVIEVLSGVPWCAAAGTPPRPEFDPARHTLAEREQAKAEELARMGVSGTSARTVRRKRQSYQIQGMTGLADGRAGRREAPGARLDPRIVETVRDIMHSHTSGQRLSSERVRAEVLRRLADPVFRGEISPPSRSAIHRLRTELAGSSPLYRRRSEVSVTVGERVHLDVMPLPLHSGVKEQVRVRVMFAMDEATRLVVTAVAHCDGRPFSVAPAVLARMCVPQDERTGWLRLRSAGQGPARTETGPAVPSIEPSPLVRPQTLVFDHADWPGMSALRNVCGKLGILAARRTPALRSAVERSMAQAASLFTDYLLSPAGQEARAAGWPQDMVQELLDTWVMRVWPYADVPLSRHTRDGERTPLARYSALTSSTGWIPTPLPPGQFADLLSQSRRTIGPTGLRLLNRIYYAPALDPLRHAGTAGPGRAKKFEVRWDPYDMGHVWVQGPDDRWLKVPAVGRSPQTPQEAVVRMAHEQLGPRGRSSSRASEPGPMPRGTGRATEIVATARPVLPEALHAPPFVPALAEDHVSARDESQRLAYHAQLPICSPDIEDAARRIEEVLLLNEASQGSRYGVLVHGPAGSGKTTVLAAAAFRLAQNTSRPAAAEGSPAIHVQLSPATSPRLLLAELARSFGIPLRGSPATADLAKRVSHAMEDAQTSLVLIDEAHYLRSPGWSQAAVADVLDYLCDRMPATFVYAGLDDPDRLASSITQARHRRLLSVGLSDLPEAEAWTELVRRAEQDLRLREHVPGTLTGLSSTLHRRTGGNVGQLAFLLRAAAVRAILDGTEQLTATLLSELPLPGQTARAAAAG